MGRCALSRHAEGTREVDSTRVKRCVLDCHVMVKRPKDPFLVLGYGLEGNTLSYSG